MTLKLNGITPLTRSFGSEGKVEEKSASTKEAPCAERQRRKEAQETIRKASAPAPLQDSDCDLDVALHAKAHR